MPPLILIVFLKPGKYNQMTNLCYIIINIFIVLCRFDWKQSNYFIQLADIKQITINKCFLIVC
jgi:hypothetical protein